MNLVKMVTIFATNVKNMMVVLALVSSMHPLTTAKEFGSELILPVKRQGVPPLVKLRGICSVVLFGRRISSRREFNHLTFMSTVAAVVVSVAVTLSSSSSSSSVFSSFSFSSWSSSFSVSLCSSSFSSS